MRGVFKTTFLTIDAFLMSCGLLQFAGVTITGKTIVENVAEFMSRGLTDCRVPLTFPNETFGEFIVVYFVLFFVGTTLAVLMRILVPEGGRFEKLIGRIKVDGDHWSPVGIAFTLSGFFYFFCALTITNGVSRFFECWGYSYVLIGISQVVLLIILGAIHLACAFFLSEWLFQRKTASPKD